MWWWVWIKKKRKWSKISNKSSMIIEMMRGNTTTTISRLKSMTPSLRELQMKPSSPINQPKDWRTNSRATTNSSTQNWDNKKQSSKTWELTKSTSKTTLRITLSRCCFSRTWSSFLRSREEPREKVETIWLVMRIPMLKDSIDLLLEIDHKFAINTWYV